MEGRRSRPSNLLYIYPFQAGHILVKHSALKAKAKIKQIKFQCRIIAVVLFYLFNIAIGLSPTLDYITQSILFNLHLTLDIPHQLDMLQHLGSDRRVFLYAKTDIFNISNFLTSEARKVGCYSKEMEIRQLLQFCTRNSFF